MEQRKKFFNGFIAAILCLSLTACGAAANSGSAADRETKEKNYSYTTDMAAPFIMTRRSN